MRLEILLILATAAIVWNMYTDGKLVKTLFKYTKYYRMAGVVLGALFLYYLIYKNPLKAKEMIIASNEYIKNGGIGIDRTTGRWLTPILDFTTGQRSGGQHSGQGTAQRSEAQRSGGQGVGQGTYGGQGQVPRPSSVQQYYQQLQDGQRGPERVKRSVSETKKKFVASRQQWKCLECQQTLPGTFQVDHIIPLENHGTNDIQNLRALCPNCHAAKTAFDHL